MDVDQAIHAMEIVRREIAAIRAGMLGDTVDPGPVFDQVFVPRFEEMYDLAVVPAGDAYAVEILADGDVYGALCVSETQDVPGNRARILAAVAAELASPAVAMEDVGPGVLRVVTGGI